MRDIKVTIIIPIHNSAQYLKKCIDSCLNQTLQDIEIILVDDASTDNSPNMIREYAKKYENKIIPIYLRENIRQGGARNLGIKVAKGEYLAFVDSDDWIASDMCERLYEAAITYNADMAGGNCFITTDTEDIPKQLDYKSSQLGKECKANIEQYLLGQGYFWNRIYKRSMILKHQIFFPEKIFYEDAYFNFLTALYSNRIIKVEECFYHYYQSPNSTIRAKNQERLYDRIPLVRKLAEDCQERGLSEIYPEEVENKIVSMSASSILYNCLEGFDAPEAEKIGEICRDIRKYCPNYKNSTAYERLNVYLKWYLTVAMISSRLAIWSYQHGVNTILGYVEAAKNRLVPKKVSKNECD